MVFCIKDSIKPTGARLFGSLGELQKSTDAARDGILGDWWIGQTSQLFQRRISMVETKLAGRFEVVWNVISKNLKRLTNLVACFRSRLAERRILASSKLARRLALPRASPSERFPVHSRAERGAPIRMSIRSMASGSRRVTRSELRSLRGLAVMPRRRAVETSARAAHGSGTRFQDSWPCWIGQTSVGEERAAHADLICAILPLMISLGRPSTMFLV